MHTTDNINVNQLIQLIRRLPPAERRRVKFELERPPQSRVKAERSEFQKFLLRGPVMTDEEHQQYNINRQRISQWRTR